jgi:hypothetical protein
MLKAGTAANVMVLMVDSLDHVTGKASLTLAITASKDGGAFASITPTVTERGSGWYALALTTSHTDTLGDLALHITATGADPTDLLCRVVAVDHADAAGFGLSRLDAAVSSRSTYAGADTAGTTTLLGRVTGTRAGNLDNLDAAVGSRLAGASYVAPDNATIAAIGAKTGNLPASPAAVGSAMTLAAGAIGDASFTTPAESGPPTGVVGMLVWLAQRLGLRRVRKTATAIEVYTSGGVTVRTSNAYTVSGTTEDVGGAT